MTLLGSLIGLTSEELSDIARNRTVIHGSLIIKPSNDLMSRIFNFLKKTGLIDGRLEQLYEIYFKEEVRVKGKPARLYDRIVEVYSEHDLLGNTGQINLDYTSQLSPFTNSMVMAATRFDYEQADRKARETAEFLRANGVDADIVYLFQWFYKKEK